MENEQQNKIMGALIVVFALMMIATASTCIIFLTEKNKLVRQNQISNGIIRNYELNRSQVNNKAGGTAGIDKNVTNDPIDESGVYDEMDNIESVVLPSAEEIEQEHRETERQMKEDGEKMSQQIEEPQNDN